MARITVNETGTHPTILLSTDIANGNIDTGNIAGANVLAVTCLQDVTITASTGIYSYVDFCSPDTNKLPTPADNEISMNVVIDPTVYFGNNSAASGSAANEGLSGLSQDKIPVQFLVVWNYDANIANITDGNIGNLTNVYYSSGRGFVSSLAPTASPEAPVWVTPMTIAVDGTMYSGVS